MRNRRADEAERRLLMDPEGEGSRQRREGEIRALKMPALRRRLLALGEPTDGRKPELLARLLELECPETELQLSEGGEGEGEAPLLLEGPAEGEGEGEGEGDGDEATQRQGEREEEEEATQRQEEEEEEGGGRRRRVTFGSDVDARAAAEAESHGLEAEVEEALRSEVVLQLGHRQGEGTATGSSSAGAAAGEEEEQLPAPPTAWEVADAIACRVGEEEYDEEEQQALMDELNTDLDTLDDEVEGDLGRYGETTRSTIRFGTVGVWVEGGPPSPTRLVVGRAHPSSPEGRWRRT